MNKENEIIEYKESLTQLKKGVISIVSILNKHSKGQLIFGIKDNGIIKGVSIGKDTLRNISKTISDYIEPKIYPEIKEDNNCIIIKFQGKDMPYFAYGRAYIRTADEDKVLSSKELENLILKKENYKWDSKISEAKIKDINEKLLKDYIKKSKDSGRINFNYTRKENVLKKLELIKNKQLLNASNILFCNNSLLEVQTAVFAGTDKITFLDISNK